MGWNLRGSWVALDENSRAGFAATNRWKSLESVVHSFRNGPVRVCRLDQERGVRTGHREWPELSIRVHVHRKVSGRAAAHIDHRAGEL